MMMMKKWTMSQVFKENNREKSRKERKAKKRKETKSTDLVSVDVAVLVGSLSDSNNTTTSTTSYVESTPASSTSTQTRYPTSQPHPPLTLFKEPQSMVSAGRDGHTSRSEMVLAPLSPSVSKKNKKKQNKQKNKTKSRAI